MGTGASKEPPVGVRANPRVVYTDQLSKKENKNLSIDTPVLVDVEHGSIRYRYGSYKGEPSNKSRRIEKSYEGNDKINKQHYFYHARLNDFGKEASETKEDPSKFIYVAKGPNRAHQKKVFYVFGKGWNAMDGQKVLPTSTQEEGRDYAWSSTRKPNDVYYNLTFIPQGNDLTVLSGSKNLFQTTPKDEDVIGDLRQEEDGCWKVFKTLEMREKLCDI
ncbi:hypothetical protein KUTeg_006913 [Tegillarca granosa]|uniref:Uncharacterized protein n=2 Tax=Tegillarca granosa TaxID=220873 RepID=A0ABQ9FBQ9_TEGGR|nr:hypothetical protein KUTeg_006913 [Tegillarca granosa]